MAGGVIYGTGNADLGLVVIHFAKLCAERDLSRIPAYTNSHNPIGGSAMRVDGSNIYQPETGWAAQKRFEDAMKVGRLEAAMRKR